MLEVIESEWTMIKAYIVEEVQGSHGDGFSAGLKEVQANPQMALEKKARLSQEGQLLTQSGDVVEQCREHFVEPLNLANMSSWHGGLWQTHSYPWQRSLR